jgi:hypothetical protein
VPTTDSATWCLTPTAVSAARRLRAEVWKKFSTAVSSQAGALDTSTTTWGALERFGQSLAGEGVDARGRRRRQRIVAILAQLLDDFDPIRPLPPITTIFILSLSPGDAVSACGSTLPPSLLSGASSPYQ